MENYLTIVKKQLFQYKALAERAMDQVSNQGLLWQYNEESNSIVIIVTHLAGNMISRFTDFLTSDGEKSWRDRDREFINDETSREQLLIRWQQGWDCLLQAVNHLQPDDLRRIVQIRNEDHMVIEALNRQLAHISYHVGQIVFIAKMEIGNDWKTLSIPRKINKD